MKIKIIILLICKIYHFSMIIERAMKLEVQTQHLVRHQPQIVKVLLLKVPRQNLRMKKFQNIQLHIEDFLNHRQYLHQNLHQRVKYQKKCELNMVQVKIITKKLLNSFFYHLTKRL